MAWTTPVVEVAFDHPPTTVVGITWTDITAYVLNISISRGRSSELSQFSAGTCSLALRNEDRRFDPEHAAGPYYGKLLPKRRMRVRSGSSYLFDGYVDGWPMSIDYESNRTVTEVNAIDAFELFASMSLMESAYEAFLMSQGPEAYYRLDDPMVGDGSPVVDSSGNGRHGTTFSMTSADYTEETPVGIAQTVVFSLPTSVVIMPNTITAPADAWQIAFWLKVEPRVSGSFDYVMYLSAYFSIQLGIDDRLYAYLFHSGGGGLTVISATAVDDGLWHHYVVRFSGSVSKIFQLWRDGVFVTSDTTASAFTPAKDPAFPDERLGRWGLTPAMSMHSVAFIPNYTASPSTLYQAALGWPGQLSGARLATLCEIARWPGARCNFDAGTNIMQATPELGGSVLDAMQKVAASEDGALFCTGDGMLKFMSRYAINVDPLSANVQATFGDGPGELRYTAGNPSQDIANIHNSVTVQRKNGVPQLAEDAASIVLFWRRGEGLKRTDLLLLTDAEARSMAEWLLARYSQPVTRVRHITVDVRAGAAELAQAIARDLQDRIAFKRKPNNIGAQVSYEGLIDGIGHDIDLSNRSWETSWNLAPAAGTKVFIFDDADRGRLGAYPMGY